MLPVPADRQAEIEIDLVVLVLVEREIVDVVPPDHRVMDLVDNTTAQGSSPPANGSSTGLSFQAVQCSPSGLYATLPTRR